MLKLNVPTPDGVEAGQHLARFCDTAAQTYYTNNPHAPHRCATCAFRAGTVPNGCAPTVMDALKSVVEGVTFHCHEPHREGKPCAGWLVLRSQSQGIPRRAPWPFSDEMERASLLDHIRPELVDSRCPLDTDGDSDCAFCHMRQGGCYFKDATK